MLGQGSQSRNVSLGQSNDRVSHERNNGRQHLGVGAGERAVFRMIPAILTALSRHYLDAYAGLVPFAVVTLLALTTAPGALHFLAAWSAVRFVTRTMRRVHHGAA